MWQFHVLCGTYIYYMSALKKRKGGEILVAGFSHASARLHWGGGWGGGGGGGEGPPLTVNPLAPLESAPEANLR